MPPSSSSFPLPLPPGSSETPIEENSFSPLAGINARSASMATLKSPQASIPLQSAEYQSCQVSSYCFSNIGNGSKTMKYDFAQENVMNSE